MRTKELKETPKERAARLAKEAIEANSKPKPTGATIRVQVLCDLPSLGFKKGDCPIIDSTLGNQLIQRELVKEVNRGGGKR